MVQEDSLSQLGDSVIHCGWTGSSPPDWKLLFVLAQLGAEGSL